MENTEDTVISTVPRRARTDFFDLPTEIRYQIYSNVLLFDRVIDFDPRNYRTIHKSLRVFCVSKRFHAEASHYFYNQNTFRLFPVHGNFFGDRQMPLIRCLTPSYRSSVSRIELLFGPGWTKPPRSWRVNKALGLKDLTSLKSLNIYIEIDPSHPQFAGFRRSETFYTEFASKLFRKILATAPCLEEVRFDGYPLPTLKDPLLSQLREDTIAAGKRVSLTGIWRQSFLEFVNPSITEEDTRGIELPIRTAAPLIASH